MTLLEGKNRVYQITDEYSVNGRVEKDEDMELKLNSLFDTAQRQAALTRRIVRLYTVPTGGGEKTMPADFGALICVWRAGRRYSGYQWRAGRLLIPNGETAAVEVEYSAVPDEINGETPEEYQFEVAEDVAAVLPYYVAAVLLAVDEPQVSQLLMSYYREAAARSEQQVRERQSGVRNTLWRHGR